MLRDLKRRIRRAAWFEQLERRHLLALDTFAITEFMASNSASLVDDDGDFSDWIEIHNTTNETQSLQGWALTDDAADPFRWRFPADAVLQPGEYRVVFASGKDRTQLDLPWHTDFKLSADGEYLAITNPAGEVAQSFDEFPPQLSDQSYGLPVEQMPLIDVTAPQRWHVTTSADDTIVNKWMQPSFDAAAWQAGAGGLGFDTRAGYPNLGFEAGDLSDWSTSGIVRVAASSEGVAAPQGNFQSLISATEEATGRFGLETFLGLQRGQLDTVGQVTVTRGSGIKRTVHVEANSVLEFDWNFVTDEPSLGGSQDFAFLSVSPGNELIVLGDVSSAEDLSNSEFDRESGYRTYQHTFAEAGDFTIGWGVVNESNRFLNSGLFVDNLTIDGVGAVEAAFSGMIDTPVTELTNQAGALWTRYEFNVADLAALQQLQLNINYDDGYVAYLNGQRVVSDNAALTIRWDSLATEDRPDEAAMNSAATVLPADALRVGTNVLAIAALKSSVNDDNLLLRAELLGLGELFEQPVFFPRATPGEPNSSPGVQYVDDVVYSVPHGFFDEPFVLGLSTSTPGATIRYTLDGSTPTRDNGTTYSEPFEILGSQTVRAVALKEGLTQSSVATQSYLFTRDAIGQSRSTALAKGFPPQWSGIIVADYDMDRRIIGQNGTDLYDGRYANVAKASLLSIPTLSIVMDLDDLFGSDGIYVNPLDRGVEAERPTSVELIDPSGQQAGFQIDAGVRIQGGVSRLISSKLSLRLLFKDEYGASKLDYPLFGIDGPTTFDSISLRASSGEHLIGIHYIRDEFARRLQGTTGNAHSQGTYMHLYINGLYWGLYNPVERIDGQYAANHYGGEKENYDVLNAGDFGSEGISAVAGSLDAWNRMIDLARQVETAPTQEARTQFYLQLQGLNPDGSRNPDYPVYLDADNFIDYLITQVYVRNSDWPIRNYYMLRDRGPDSTGFKFFIWDGEFTLDRGALNSLSGIGREGPGVLYDMLDNSEAFRVAFSDRIQEHFSRGGAFYVNPDRPQFDPEHPEDNLPAALYASLVEQVGPVLGPEAARWGDEEARNGRLFVPHVEWQAIVDANLSAFFPNRSRDFLIDARRLGFYRDAPSFSVAPGLITPGTDVQIIPKSGTVYYTLDGTDPRAADGTLSPTAVEYTGPIAIAQRTNVRTRSLAGSSWSALSVGAYFTDALPATAADIGITEVNYNPHDALLAREPDVNNDDFEFIEIVNRSDHPINLSGAQLVAVQGQGVTFTFGEQLLAAGAYVVVPANRTAFVGRYGDSPRLAVGVEADPNVWIYQGRLSNGGERITLLSPDGELADRIEYADGNSWPQRADGGGSSLERVSLESPGNVAVSFRASAAVGGSPGRASDSPPQTVRINEVLSNPLTGQADTFELVNLTASSLPIGGWFITDRVDSLPGYRLPDDNILSPNGFLTFDSSEFRFGLDALDGDSLYLIAADSAGRLTHFVDEVHFEAMPPGVSYGRWPDSVGQLFPQAATSFGAVNTGPLLSNLVVSEIHLQPQDPDRGGLLTEEDFEFIELYNRGNETIDLSEWTINGNVEWTFAEGTQLAPEASIIVVPFDPQTGTRAVSFRLSFPSAVGAAMVGPWAGSLPDDGGSVRLLHSIVPSDDAAWPAYMLSDAVRFGGNAPWPSDTHATGRSLQRNSAIAFGDTFLSWRSAAANPGVAAFQQTASGDLDADGKLDVPDIDLMCGAIQTQKTDLRFDLTADGNVDHADYDYLVSTLIGTRPGDADLNGVFNSADLVKLFVASEYEDDIEGNSTWSDGDWNCDGEFTTRDLVAAYLVGGYTVSSTASSTASSVATRSVNVNSNAIAPVAVDRVLAVAAWHGRARRTSLVDDEA
ncbi:MAG: lamin tail domain-containing protein [Planctomycetales bacterium]|nr:lamin tail domain-containing protein [Planctomycetales bacterium]